MKKQLSIPDLTFLLMMAVSIAAGKTHAASGIRSGQPNSLQYNTGVYQRVLNPYINIKTDQRAVGSTYVVRDRNGNIIKSGVITSGKICTVPTAKLTAGEYTVHVGGYLLQQFTIV